MSELPDAIWTEQITCNSCPAPFLGFIGNFDARWSVAWEPETGDGNFWVSSQVTLAGFQGQVECLEPANNPMISFSGTSLALIVLESKALFPRFAEPVIDSLDDHFCLVCAQQLPSHFPLRSILPLGNS